MWQRKNQIDVSGKAEGEGMKKEKGKKLMALLD